MESRKPVASLSFDLDNKWSYLKTHGDKQWETFPSFLDIVAPRVLSFLEARNLKITFFVVGQDAALPENSAALRALADAGHEIGNHSFSHDPWLHLYSQDAIDTELQRAEEHIEAVTGQHPVGFRGPAYSFSMSTLRVLKKRGYVYDCSTFPTFLGPLARLYYFMTARFSAEEKAQRKKLFGAFREGLRPNKAYCWQIDEEELVEIPVTTMPIFKLPMHANYVLYLSHFSRPLAILYFRMALLLCRLTGVQPSLLLHPLDFLSNEDTTGLEFFPTMNLATAKKLDMVSALLKMMEKHYRIVPMETHVAEVLRTSRTEVVKPQLGAMEAN